MMTLLPAALGLLLQSTVLLLIGLLALRLTRRHGPAVQSLVGRATLAGVGLALLLAAPLTGHIRPLWHVTMPGTSAEPTASTPIELNSGRKREEPTPPQAATPPETGGQSASFTSVPPPGPPVPGGPLRSDLSQSKEVGSSLTPSNGLMPIPRPSPLRRLYPSLTAAWGIGTALLLLWLGVCQRHLTWLRRVAHPITSGPAAEMLPALTPRPPTLLAHASVRSPFLAGLWHPAIFLPAAYDTDFDPIALRAILAHELAHLARRDNAWTLAARLLSALLWPQPRLWVLCRRLEQIGEEACDQAVLAQNCPPRVYADCLLTLAERYPLGHRERALGAGVAPFRSSLGQRIACILDKGTHAMSTVTPRLRLTIAALTVAASLGSAFLLSSAPAQVYAGPTRVLAQTGRPSLVGTWLGPDYGGTRVVMIFSADGNVEQVGPWPENNQQVFHGYGHYAVQGPKLTYILTRGWLEGQKPWTTDPEKHVMDYALSGDVLTLHLKGKWTNVEHRIPAYTNAMLGIKTAAVPEAQPSAASDKQLSQARFLAGLTPVQGPGIVVTLRDSKQHLPRNMPPGMTPPNIIHDSDINQVVNELKAAGAEAIAVNGQRLVATSSVRTAGPTILINFTPTVPPYVIKAIGSPKTLAAAMNLPGGVANQLKAYDPTMFSVREDGTLTLPAYSGGGSEPRYARPVGMSGQPQLPAGNSAGRALVEQRDQLQRQMFALESQITALKALLLAIQARAQAAARGVPSNTSLTSDPNEIERRIVARELAVARADVIDKQATYGPRHPALMHAQAKAKSLEKAYQTLPMVEKQTLVQRVALSKALADANKAPSRQLSSVQRQKRQLQAEIALLNGQIAHYKVQH